MSKSILVFLAHPELTCSVVEVWKAEVEAQPGLATVHDIAAAKGQGPIDVAARLLAAHQRTIL